MTKRILGVAVLISCVSGLIAVPAQAAPGRFPTCAELTATYPKGIANNKMMADATGAKLSPKLYAKNKKLDKDKDGVACWGASDA